MSLKNKGKQTDGASSSAGGATSQQPRVSNQGGAGAKAKPRFSSPASSPAATSATGENLPYPSSLNLGTNGLSSRPSSRLSGTLSPAPATPAAAPPPNAWAQKPSFASAARPSSAASAPSNAATTVSEPAPVSTNGEKAAGPSAKAAAPTPPATVPSPSPSPAPAVANGMPAQIASAQGLLNSHVTIVTTKETYDGILTDLARQIQQKGAARPHVILQKACIKGMKRDVMIREWQGSYDDIVSIAKWTLDPTEASPPPSAGAGKGRKSEGGFRTDADISRAAQLGQERVLVAWDAGSPPPASSALHGGLDADTFGSSASASGGAGSKKGGWDQFAENERRFGTKTDFDEEMYTTKLVRNGEGFKDRERKAEAMAREIMGTASSNPHMQEERGQAVSSALGEEDRYSGVVRSANAYVPPSARKPSTPASGPPVQAPIAPTPPPVVLQRSNSPIMDPAVVRSSSSGGPNAAKLSPAAPALSKAPSSGITEGSVDSPSADKSVLAAFQDFVKSDRQRLEQKKKLIDSKVKSEKDKKLKELMKFGQDFKLKTAIPQDLVPILAKDAEKQKAIVEKAAADALAAKLAPSPPMPSPKVRLAQPGLASGVHFSTPQAPPSTKGRSSMIISDIPPFNPNKRHGALPAGSPAPPSPAASMASSTGARSMNAGAQPFVFKPTIPAFKPAAGRSPGPIVREIPPFNGGTPKGTPKAGAASLASSPSLPKAAVVGGPSSTASAPLKATAAAAASPAATGPVNPFFGTKVPKRSAVPVSVRDDFNPHRMSKLAMAPSYPPNWPYGARSFRAAFPPMFAAADQHALDGNDLGHQMQPHLQQQHAPHLHHPQQGLVLGGPGGMQPHLVSPSMLHSQPYGPAYGAGGYYQPYRFTPQPGMPQGMNPNAAGGPSGTVNGGSNFHQQGQPGGGFVPMFQPGGGPPGAAGSAPYGVQVMMLPQGGMYAAMPGYQGQPGQQPMGGPPFLAGAGGGGQASVGGRGGGAGGAGAGGGGPTGFYAMQQGPGGHPQMQSPQMGHVYQPQFMAGGHMQPPPHFSGGGGQPPPPQQQQSPVGQQQPSPGGGAEQQN